MKDSKQKIIKKEEEKRIEVFEELLERLDNDPELVLFYTKWVENARDATAAAKEMYPNKDWTQKMYSYKGYTLLKRIKDLDRGVILEAYGIGIDSYVKQLKEGMEASKFVDDGEGMVEVPDHKVRRDYHKAAGELLGFEAKDAGFVNRININKMVNQWAMDATEILDGEVVE